MNRTIAHVAVVALCGTSLLLTACGGGTEPPKAPDAPAVINSAPPPPATAAPPQPVEPTPVPAPAAAAPLAIEGIKMVGKSKDGKTVSFEVKSDGSVVKDGKTLATFVNNELKDDKGATVFTVAADGTVTSPNLKGGPMTFSDKDVVVVGGHPVLSIDDDGTPSLDTNGKQEKAPFKFEKLPAKSKRAAELLVMYLLRNDQTVSTTTATSSTPATAPTLKKK